MNDNNLIDRLAKTLSHIDGISREELEWLVNHGELEFNEANSLIAEKGKRIPKLWIILSGLIVVKRDHGAGPRRVAQWGPGEVSGMLPYSRMKGPAGDNFIEVGGEFLTIHEKYFPEMVHLCPVFTAYTVHSMIDRARSFNTSDLHAEKMISLGKLAAGLAHELNNPASAAIQSAKWLRTELDKLESASHALSAARLSDDLINKIKQFQSACMVKSTRSVLSPIQMSEHEDKISDWLLQHNIEATLAEPLSATSVTIDRLNELAKMITGDKISIVLNWIAASCTTRSIAEDIEKSTARISELVSAIKRFTYMDKLAGLEYIELEGGIRDTIKIIDSKVKSKEAVINIEIESNLPRVQASGGELNQIWINLIDNALDAISNNGRIDITARREKDKVVVCIIDNGTGIPQDIISRIFDPFFTTKPTGQGTGLGLDVTRRYLHQSHGDITVESQPGRTEFRVSLLAEDTV